MHTICILEEIDDNVSRLFIIRDHIDGLVQERLNSIANALELHLSCTNPPIYFLPSWASYLLHIVFILEEIDDIVYSEVIYHQQSYLLWDLYMLSSFPHFYRP